MMSIAIVQRMFIERTDKFQLLKLERKLRGSRVLYALNRTQLLSNSKIISGNTLPIDIQVKTKVEVQEVVGNQDFELLIARQLVLLMLTNGIFGILTFPASLATNAVVEFEPSCFTSYVSSSFSSHMIEKLNDCSVKGMVRMEFGPG
jgi:hypothetical protein